MNTNDWEKNLRSELSYLIAEVKESNDDSRIVNVVEAIESLLKERDLSLIAELEGRYKELVWKEEETNGEYVQKIGFNSALDLIISNLRERIQ